VLKLLKNIECFTPDYQGYKDIVILKDIIYKISEPGSLINLNPDEIYDCKNLLAFPGIIDGHVHIIGGGGENGPCSRLNEISFEEIILSGITTLVGLLGADKKTKSLVSLYAKAKALQKQGITTFMFSGSYEYPPITLTGDITNDMVLIDKVIGVGEIAISDVRSSHPDIKQMLELSSQTYMGSLLSGKAGIVHIHVGDGKNKINLLEELLEKSEFPKKMFVPTHLNRNEELFYAGIAFALQGGNIDLTAGEKIGVSIPDALIKIISKKINLENITISSDGNSSMPQGGVNSIKTLFDDIKQSIIEKNIDPSVAFSFVTSNVAKTLKLYPQKGVLCEGSDADILILDKDYNIQKLFAMGNLLIDKGKII
jgi:beta-aspartyl-dipeptidase (metallo-type)